MSGGDLSEAFRKHADALGAQFLRQMCRGLRTVRGTDKAHGSYG